MQRKSKKKKNRQMNETPVSLGGVSRCDAFRLSQGNPSLPIELRAIMGVPVAFLTPGPQSGREHRHRRV